MSVTEEPADEGDYEVPDDVGNPLWHLIRRYARPHTPRYVVAVLGTALAQVPQRLPALVVGVALDAVLLSSTPYALPGVPRPQLVGHPPAPGLQPE